MEPLHKVTKFGISGRQRNGEIVSVPNLLRGSVPTTQQIMIKFHWELFEQMRKIFIRPEMTSNNVSSNALHVELASIDNQALAKNQDIVDKLEYNAQYSNVYYAITIPSKCHFKYLTNHYSCQAVTHLTLS